MKVALSITVLGFFLVSCQTNKDVWNGQEITVSVKSTMSIASFCEVNVSNIAGEGVIVDQVKNDTQLIRPGTITLCLYKQPIGAAVWNSYGEALQGLTALGYKPATLADAAALFLDTATSHIFDNVTLYTLGTVYNAKYYQASIGVDISEHRIKHLFCVVLSNESSLKNTYYLIRK